MRLSVATDFALTRLHGGTQNAASSAAVILTGGLDEVRLSDSDGIPSGTKDITVLTVPTAGTQPDFQPFASGTFAQSIRADDGVIQMGKVLLHDSAAAHRFFRPAGHRSLTFTPDQNLNQNRQPNP